MKHWAESHNKNTPISAGSPPDPRSEMRVHLSQDWHLAGSLELVQTAAAAPKAPRRCPTLHSAPQGPSMARGKRRGASCTLWSLAELWFSTDLKKRKPGISGDALHAFLQMWMQYLISLFCLPWEIHCDLGLGVRNWPGYTETGIKIYMRNNKIPAVQAWI